MKSKSGSVDGRVFLSFDEARDRLGLDVEGFRQALLYHLQEPESGNWVRALIQSNGSAYVATIDGDLSQKPNIRDQSPALDRTGGVIPNDGGDAFGGWSICGSDRGTGYGAVYRLEGTFVVNPQNIKWIAEEAGRIDWGISNLLSVAPIFTTDDGNFPDIYFTIVSDKGGGTLPVPSDAKELVFFAKDIDGILNTDSGKRSREKNLDSRERTTLLNIIGVLADEAKLDLNQHMKAGDQVAAMLACKGITISGRTIGEHLKAVREAMDSRK